MDGSKNKVNPDMEVTPERALKIKQALIRQYEDQFGVKVTGWKEERSKPTATT